MNLVVEPFNRNRDRSVFDCGNPDLKRWLSEYAGQSEKRNTARTFFLVDDLGNICGYYATTACQLAPDEVAEELGVGKSKYPVSAILIARFAIDRSCQGKGAGRFLLGRALSQLVEVSKEIGFEIVVVDAIDHDAAAFYGRFGFKRLQDDDLHLFLTTKDLRLTFDSI